MGLTRPRAAQIFDIDYKQATRVITVVNITLTGGAPAVVDGVSLVLNDRVLVTGQTTASQNGLYDVTVVGVGSDGTWARTSDGNTTGEILAGMMVMVTEGSVYADTQWKLTTDNPIVIGTTALTFELNTSGNSISNGTSNLTVLNNANVNVTVANVQIAAFASTGSYITGLVSATGNITGGNVLGGANVNATTHTGTTVSVSANVTGGNILTGGLISAAGNITGNYFIGNGSQLTGIAAGTPTSLVNGTSNVVVSSSGNVTVNVAGAVNVATFATTGLILPGIVSVTGNVTAGNLSGTNIVGTLTTAAQTSITSVGTLTSLNSGAISSSSTVTGTSFVGIATSARYADLAENYLADAAYAPGTVVEFGGDAEVTVSTVDHSTAVAGVVSTDPAYLMNSHLQGVYIVAVALIGRVPCLVQGPVKKGSVLVTSTVPGTAMAIDNLKFKPGCVVGKAMETIDSVDVKTIEVAVGRL